MLVRRKTVEEVKMQSVVVTDPGRKFNRGLSVRRDFFLMRRELR